MRVSTACCEFRCVVIEDTNIGVVAARAAGMRCVVTVSSYTKDEDFTIADAVFDQIEGNFVIDDLTTPGAPSLHAAAVRGGHSLLQHLSRVLCTARRACGGSRYWFGTSDA